MTSLGIALAWLWLGMVLAISFIEAPLKFRVVDEQDRVRKHMRLFVGQDETRDVGRAVEPGDELLIFRALSGG